MDFYGFYTDRSFDADHYLGAHLTGDGAVFRTFAPSAQKISLIGEFNGWEELPMAKVYDLSLIHISALIGLQRLHQGMKHSILLFSGAHGLRPAPIGAHDMVCLRFRLRPNIDTPPRSFRLCYTYHCTSFGPFGEKQKRLSRPLRA